MDRKRRPLNEVDCVVYTRQNLKHQYINPFITHTLKHYTKPKELKIQLLIEFRIYGCRSLEAGLNSNEPH